MLILKPYVCYEILFQLKSIAIASIKLEIVEKLTWLISKRHTNSFILTNQSTLRQTKSNSYIHFMNELIDLLIDNNRENVLSENILIFIEKVIHHSGLKSKYINHILLRISELFEDYDGNKFVLMLKLLNVYI